MAILTAADIVEAIDTAYAKAKEDKARRYIGASGIGNQCDAYQNLSLRGFPNDPPDPRLKRIFQMGHDLEEIVVADLKKKADLRVWEVDGLTGDQYTYKEYGGHVICHMDGHMELDDGVVRCLEIKSMNANSFDKFQKVGMKRSHPHYYAQVQMMMGMSGMTETVFIAICKNNSAYHAELVKADPFEYAFIRERIDSVINQRAKKRIATDPLDWRCKGCFKRSSCWVPDEITIEPTCSRCTHARPRSDGAWHCTRYNKEAVDVCGEFSLFTVEPRDQ